MSGDVYSVLVEHINQSTGYREVLSICDRARDHLASSDLSGEDYLRLIWQAFNPLREASDAEVDVARQAVLQHLLPICLKPASRWGKGGMRYQHKVRDLLADLLAIPSFAWRSLRDETLVQLIGSIRKNRSLSAIYTAARIGYRTPELEAILLTVAQNQSKVGDAAVAALVDLGTDVRLRARLLDMIKERSTNRPLRALLYPLQKIGGREALDVLLSLSTSLAGDKVATWERDLYYSALTYIADQASEDKDVQEEVWGLINSAALSNADLRSSTYLGTHAPSCNTARVVGDLLSLLVLDENTSKPNSIRRYLTYLRLSECHRPNQLDGWRQHPSDVVLNLLRSDSISDTKAEGDFTTQEMRLKESAWSIALSFGIGEVCEWLGAAVRGETNGYVRQKIMEKASCLAMPELPSIVTELITSEYDASDGNDGGELISRLEALHLAKSANSEEAFEAVIGCGLTYRGAPLVAAGDALVSLSISLFPSKEEEISERLISTALAGDHYGQKITAIYTLLGLSRNGMLDAKYAGDLLRLAQDANLDVFARAFSLEALGYLSGLSEESIPAILMLAHDESDVGWRAIEVLVRKGVIFRDGVDGTASLLKRIGIEKDNQGWRLSGLERVGRDTALLVGLLYQIDQAGFADVMELALKKADEYGYRILASFLSADSEELRFRLANVVTSRIRSNVGLNYVDTGLFEDLKGIDQSRIVEENWEAVWNDWHLQARRALADVIGSCSFRDPRLRARSIILLNGLAGDGDYLVRRSAYRAFARLEPESLAALIQVWADSLEVEERKRAAEARAWIMQGQLRATLPNLKSDPDRSVREVYLRAESEYRERSWAESYKFLIHDAEEFDNSAVLRLYPYGRALARVGDDSDITELLEFLRTTLPPPHFSRWIVQIAEEIEERRKRSRQANPGPWIELGSIVEDLQGTIRSGEVTGKARFSLWRRVPKKLSEFGAWRGIVRLEEDPLKWLWASKIELIVEGRRSAVALVRHSSLGLLMISGSGDYPDRL